MQEILLCKSLPRAEMPVTKWLFGMFHIHFLSVASSFRNQKKFGESWWKKYMNTKTPFISTFDLYDHLKSFGLVITFVSRSWLEVRLAVLKKNYIVFLAFSWFPPCCWGQAVANLRMKSHDAQNPQHSAHCVTSHPPLLKNHLKGETRAWDYQDRWPYILDKNEFIYF